MQDLCKKVLHKKIKPLTYFLLLLMIIPFSFAIEGEDFFLRIARENVTDMSSLHKFGRNPDIDSNSGFEAIWSGGGDYTGFNATTAEIVEIFSSSGDDDVGGVGAITVQLIGLNSTFYEINETITLNGTTPVNTTLSYIRLHRAIVRESGSAETNQGDITARQVLFPGNVFVVLPIGYGQTMISAFTVPEGKRGFIVSHYAVLAKKQTGFSNVRLMYRLPNLSWNVKEEFTISASGSSYVSRSYDVPKVGIPSRTDIKIMADSSVNDNAIASGFDMILVNNNLKEVEGMTLATVVELSSLIYIVIGLATILLFVYLWKEDIAIATLSGILYFTSGVFIAINGFSSLNNFLTIAIAAVFWGLGAYIFIGVNLEYLESIF